MSFALCYDYEHEIGTLRRILEVSQRTQWNVTDFDWGRGTPDTAYGRVLDWQGLYRSDYIKALTGTEKDRLAKQILAYDFSQILHGEQVALMLSGQLINQVEDLDARLCAATQAKDEARHVEATKKLVSRLGPIYPSSPAFREVADELISTPVWPRKVLGLQLFLEARALLTFRNYFAFVEDPLVLEVVRNIERDESQHVAFGVQYLRTGVEALEPAEFDRLVDFGAWLDTHIWNLQPAEAYRMVFEEAGLSYEDFIYTYQRSSFLAPSRQLTVATSRALDVIHNQFHRWFYGALSRVGLDAVIDRRKGQQMSLEERQAAGIEAEQGLPWVPPPAAAQAAEGAASSAEASAARRADKPARARSGASKAKGASSKSAAVERRIVRGRARSKA